MAILTVGSALILTFLLALSLQWAALAAILRGLHRRSEARPPISANPGGAS